MGNRDELFMTAHTQAPSGWRPRFGLRSLLMSLLFVSVAMGWWTDRRHLQRELVLATEAAKFGKLKLLEQLERPGVVGTDISQFPEVPRLADRIEGDRGGDEILRSALRGTKLEYERFDGYYFKTGTLADPLPGFYVWTFQGRVVFIERIPPWD